MKKWTVDELENLVIMKQSGLTWEQIAESYPKETPNSLRKTYYRFMRTENPPTAGPKILLVDIETAPLEVFAWGVNDQVIGLEQVITDWSILSVSAKWLGSPENEVMYFDNSKEDNFRDDSKLLKLLHSLMDEADILITQNGIKFDVPKINARFVQNDMKPPSSFRQIDTYRIARRVFGFTSNKLAYMTDKLCTKYKKKDHAKFAGFSLWKECLKGNQEAWKEMKEYNIYDVLSLEELYNILAPWDKTINFSVYNEDLESRCSCGSNSFSEKGYVYSNAGKYQRYICDICGKELKGKDNLLSKEKRKVMKKV